MDVTLRGTTTPCVELKRGEERTVIFTDHVQRLITGGFVEVVAWHDNSQYDEPVEEEPLTVTEREADYQAAQSRVDADLPAQEDDDRKLADRPKPRKATRRR